MRDLREQLRSEGERAMPAFDESLHARTMQRVSAARRERLAARVAAPRLGARWLSYGGALASGAIAIAAAVWTVSPAAPDTTVAGGAELRPLLETLADASLPLRQRLNDPLADMRQNAELFREDGQRLVAFVVDQLTLMPAARPSAEPAPAATDGPSRKPA